MNLLIVAALIWIGVHVGLAGTRLRDRVVARIGEGPFRAVFSLLSIVVIVFLVRAWSVSPTSLLWVVPNWVRWILVGGDGAGVRPVRRLGEPANPTMVGAPAAMAQPPRGMFRVTRHPMLWSFAIWAAVHAIGNGDTASIVFFGAFLVTALAGMPSIDAKWPRRNPATWQALSAATSVAAVCRDCRRPQPVRLAGNRMGDVGDRRDRVGGVAVAAPVSVRRRPVGW